MYSFYKTQGLCVIYQKVGAGIQKLYTRNQLPSRGEIAYTILNETKERSVIRKMLYETVYGDVDDMIFADCDWHPSER